MPYRVGRSTFVRLRGANRIQAITVSTIVIIFHYGIKIIDKMEIIRIDYFK